MANNSVPRDVRAVNLSRLISLLGGIEPNFIARRSRVLAIRIYLLIRACDLNKFVLIAVGC